MRVAPQPCSPRPLDQRLLRWMPPEVMAGLGTHVHYGLLHPVGIVFDDDDDDNESISSINPASLVFNNRSLEPKF